MFGRTIATRGRNLATWSAACLMVALIGLLPASPSFANPGADFLQKFQGKWKGKGTARQGLKGAEEAIQCRISSEFKAETAKLDTSGKCATAQTTIKIAGSLRYHAPTDRFIGSLISGSSKSGSSFSSGGRLSGSSLVLKTVTSDSHGQVTSRGKITITPKGTNSYTIASQVTDVKSGKTYKASDIIFKR